MIMAKFKTINLFFGALVIFSLFFLNITSLFAAPIFGANGKFNSGIQTTAKGTGHSALQPWFGKNSDPLDIIGWIVSIVLGLLGVFFLGLMLYGGYIWMIARGNEAEVTKAKAIIKNAIFGLIIILAAYAITAFVGSFFNKANLGV
jgi:hypothetical protein